ncbi:glycerophosphodiester phosphodiesterase [Nocardioides sp. KIGAM211]|uniref:glycerophosphodiester phosphodiesterase n=1 Tax=Nocardioides luti TaxID=2761101 RepID=A0A7X0RIM0_9ACTN|nr:glycerophosphodiester phosphodiesterase family protein [Nocardioides luti]MBB6628847.1 glycerophosphodiester phosphodiesterase [Nocardioides luti]
MTAVALPDLEPATPSLVATPAVVAHRGASGLRPEHSMQAYRLALATGADDLEIDVVTTRDRVLVCRHDAELSRTTDIAQRRDLAHLRTTKLVDGEVVTGWFVEDLLWAEVRTLRTRERWARTRWASAAYDGRGRVVTLDEVLGLVRGESRRRGRPCGVLVELKHAAYYEALGLPLHEPLLDALRRHDLDHPASPVTVMSFEATVLRRLARSARVPLVQLLGPAVDRPADVVASGGTTTFAELATPVGLARVEDWADGVGAHTGLVLADGVAPTDLVRDAHRESLTVHVWTLRQENRFLPEPYRSRAGDDAAGDLPGLTTRLLELGVDGLITDHPAVVRAARDAWAQSWGSSAQATR